MPASPLPAADRPSGAAASIPRSARFATGWAVSAAGVVLGVPFAAFVSLVLYHFYVRGSFVLDAGLEAYLISHGGLRLAYPQALGDGSYLRSHVAPILGGLSLVRRALPVSDVQFFAGFIGLAHALPGLGAFWALRSGLGLRGGGGLALAALLGIAFSFNGVALAIVRYPHFEILIVGCVILFAVALAQREPIAATVCFAIALMTREDAGFHLFGILFVLMAVNRWYGIAWQAQRAEMAFAAVAMTYSAAVLALQLALASGPSAFMQIYAGAAPFAHLRLDVLAERLLGYAVYRAYLVLPAAIALIWAVWARNPYILVGYIALLPWGLLQLIANSEIAGTLSGYYAYPIMLASFWPLVGVLFDWRRRGAAAETAVPVLAFAAMVAVSFAGVAQQYNPGRLDLAKAFLAPPSLARQAMTDRAVAQLARSKPALGTLLAGTSVVALAPDDFTPRETVLGRGSARPDTVVYLARGYESQAARRIAEANGLDRHYRVPGTAIRIATDRPIAAPVPIAALLAPGDGPDDAPRDAPD